MIVLVMAFGVAAPSAVLAGECKQRSLLDIKKDTQQVSIETVVMNMEGSKNLQARMIKKTVFSKNDGSKRDEGTETGEWKRILAVGPGQFSFKTTVDVPPMRKNQSLSRTATVRMEFNPDDPEVYCQYKVDVLAYNNPATALSSFTCAGLDTMGLAGGCQKWKQETLPGWKIQWTIGHPGDVPGI